ncbi:MAG: hypothetical protein R3A52_19860 [Polyangiales bacterium]
MNRTVPIVSLPNTLRVEDAVEAACADDIAFIEERLRRGTSVLVECDKELALPLPRRALAPASGEGRAQARRGRRPTLDGAGRAPPRGALRGCWSSSPRRSAARSTAR